VTTASSPLVYNATALESGVMGEIVRNCAPMDSDQYLNRLEDFLASPLPKSLLLAHPNDVANPSFVLPPEWETWWDWAASTPASEPWIELLSYYVAVLNPDSRSQADGLFS